MSSYPWEVRYNRRKLDAAEHEFVRWDRNAYHTSGNPTRNFTNESSAMATVSGCVLRMRQFERPIPAPVLVPAESAD